MADPLVLIINRPTGFGGIERVIETLCDGLRAHPYALKYLYTPFPESEAHLTTLRGLGVEPVAWHGESEAQSRGSAAAKSPAQPLPVSPRVRLWKRWVSPAFDQWVYQMVRTRRQIRSMRDGLAGLKLNPAIAHMHVGQYHELAAGVTTCRRAFPHARLVVHVHNPPAYFSPTRLEKRALRRADAVIFVSDDARRSWERVVGRPLRSHTLHNPFPGPIGLPQDQAGKQLRLKAVCRLSPKKGLDVALRALAHVRRAGFDLSFDILGDGPERGRLEACAREEGVEEVVRFMGFCSDPAKFFGSSDIFLQPSVSNEGLPMSLLEAMAAARPVIVTTIGGMPEAVQDGETGLVVPPSDPAALAQAILRLLRDPAWAASLGQAAARHVSERFSPQRVAGKLNAVYADLLKT